jgi:hypothetical protein
MQTSDLRVGEHYAIVERFSFDKQQASRVELVELPGRGQASVRLVEVAESARRYRRWRPGLTQVVKTRDISCRWTEWATRCEAQRAAENAREEYRKQQEAERRPDPERPLASHYESEWFNDRYPAVRDGYPEALVSAVGKNQYAADGQRQQAAALLRWLPQAAQRDLIAAVMVMPVGWSERHEAVKRAEAQPRVRVADVFARAAMVTALSVLRGRADTVSINDALLARDVDFVEACVAVVAQQGGVLGIPFAPRLPATIADISLARLGWLRVVYGSTSGTHLHHPTCHILKSNRDKVDEAPTLALWECLLARICSVCRGPGLAVSPALVAFRVASDVWAARDRVTPEQWQVGALQHLIAATIEARAVEREPDRTFAAIVHDALAADTPGREGWNAYAIVQPFHRQNDLTGEARAAACRLTYDRLHRLSALFPSGRRPRRPSPLDNDAAVDRVVASEDGESALREWWERLRHAARSVPELEFAVFGLPNAVRW